MTNSPSKKKTSRVKGWAVVMTGSGNLAVYEGATEAIFTEGFLAHAHRLRKELKAEKIRTKIIPCIVEYTLPS